MELLKDSSQTDKAHQITHLSRIYFLQNILNILKSFVDVSNHSVLYVTFLQFKNWILLLQILDLLQKADISERDESTTLLVKFDSGAVDHELKILVFKLIWCFWLDYVSKHDVSLSFPVVTTVLLVKNVLQREKTICLEYLSCPQWIVDVLT